MREGLVDARGVGKVGMEGRGHHSSLPHSYRIIAFNSDDFDFRPDALDLWSADENHFQGQVIRGRSRPRSFYRPIFFYPVFFQLSLTRFTQKKFAFADGAVDLTSVGVAAD